MKERVNSHVIGRCLNCGHKKDDFKVNYPEGEIFSYICNECGRLAKNRAICVDRWKRLPNKKGHPSNPRRDTSDI